MKKAPGCARPRRLSPPVNERVRRNGRSPVDDRRCRTREGDWPLYEVFVRGKRGLNHVHVGSLHAPDDEMLCIHARNVLHPPHEGVSIWVVPSTAIVASSPSEKDPFFATSGDKVYRHPLLRHPDNVPHM
ncbi:1,2-phenylacetyl-CoA epoxidase subunit B [Rhodococcus hoagii]|nr:1,2-phenylacetyl-CoA epoxidase subunit B [Prescottella equi]